MTIETKLVGADLVNRALRQVPAWAADEIKKEMAGMQGLGVEWKKEVAKTFVGRREGQKWIYSNRNDRKYSQLQHKVGGTSLDQLELKIWGRGGAELQELGGTVTAQKGKYLWVPVGRQRSFKDLRKRLRPSELIGDAMRFIRLPDGRLLVAEERATEKQAGRGDSKLKVLFVLRERITHSGNRLRFRATTTRLRERAVTRFERGLNRAIKRAA